MSIDQESGEMSFLDHLEELRWHLIRSLAAIAVFMVGAFMAKDFLFGTLILGPSRTDFISYRILCQLAERLNTPELCIDKLAFTIQSRTMTGQFTTHITVSFITGLILAFPYVFWEIWRFIKPGLYETEQTVTRGAVAFVSFLFFLGVLFGYYVLAPISINFLANYQVHESIINEYDLTSYISTVLMLVLSCALMFQLPMVIMVLTKAGVVNPLVLRYFRKHAIVVILVVAAVLTPPDVFSQVLLFFPIYGLYEFSILLSARIYKKQLRDAERAARGDI